MIRKRLRMLSLLSAMLCCVAVSAQHKVEMIPFGNMDQWIDRQIKESGIIGGATKMCMLSVLRQLSVKTSRIRIWAVPRGLLPT